MQAPSACREGEFRSARRRDTEGLIGGRRNPQDNPDRQHAALHIVELPDLFDDVPRVTIGGGLRGNRPQGVPGTTVTSTIACGAEPAVSDTMTTTIAASAVTVSASRAQRPNW